LQAERRHAAAVRGFALKSRDAADSRATHNCSRRDRNRNRVERVLQRERVVRRKRT
jgi:hypothetical protein